MKKVRDNVGQYERQGKGTGSAVSLASVGIIYMVILPWLVYQKGAGAAWIGIGCFGATLLLWHLDSYRLLRFSLQQKEMTIPGFVSRRFGEKTPVLRILLASLLILVLISVSVLLLYGIALFAREVFGSEMYYVAIGVILISVGFYFLVGKSGLRTLERWISILMLFSLVALNLSIFRVLGTTKILENIFHSWAAGSVSEYVNIGFMSGKRLGVTEILSLFSFGLILLGNPVSMQRFMQTDRARTIHRSRRWAIIFSLFAMFLSILLGGMLRASLYPAKINSVTDLFRWIMVEDRGRGFLFHLTGITFVVSAAVLAVSLFHTCILQITQIFHENILPSLIRRNKRRRKQHTWVFTLVLIIMEILICAASLVCGEWIYRLTLYSALILSAGLAPSIILALNYQRMTATGFMSGFLGGILMATLWMFGNWIPQGETMVTMEELTGLNAVIPGMTFGFLLGILGSRLSKEPSKEIVEAYEEVKYRLVSSEKDG